MACCHRLRLTLGYSVAAIGGSASTSGLLSEASSRRGSCQWGQCPGFTWADSESFDVAPFPDFDRPGRNSPVPPLAADSRFRFGRRDRKSSSDVAKIESRGCLRRAMVLMGQVRTVPTPRHCVRVNGRLRALASAWPTEAGGEAEAARGAERVHRGRRPPAGAFVDSPLNPVKWSCSASAQSQRNYGTRQRTR
jgi:hypothetical protein